MKSKSIVIVSLLSGWVLGVASLAALLYFGPIITVNDVMRANAEQNIGHAILIRDGKVATVARMIDDQIPSIIYMFQHIGYRSVSDLRMLWKIRDYVERYSVSMPVDKLKFLDELPQRPPSACEIQLK